MSNDLKASGSLGFRFVKRTFDIICSVILMIPIGIVIGISYFFIKAEDRGSVFIWQRELDVLENLLKCISYVL